MSLKTTPAGQNVETLIKNIRARTKPELESDRRMVSDLWNELEEWAESLPHMHLEITDRAKAVKARGELRQVTFQAMQGLLAGTSSYEQDGLQHNIHCPPARMIAEHAVEIARTTIDELDKKQY